MRTTFLRTLEELAAGDERVMLLTGDLGYTVVEPFADRFPGRFVNVGVAEQNMVALATGLAEAGFIPFVYSIITFAVLRPYEFIRNGPVLHRLPVRIVGVGGGFEYGHGGPTHHGLEDVAVTRAQPGLEVVAPADYRQARSALLATWDLPGPVFYRLGKDDRLTIPGLEGRFERGRAHLVRGGGDLLMVAMGSVAHEAVVAAEALAEEGLSVAVMVVSSLNPAPVEDLAAALGRHRQVLTVEAHYKVGGVGSLVSEVAAERALACRVVRCAVGESPDGVSGGQGFLRHRHGLSAAALAEKARRTLSEAGG
jgi:transketolase